MRACFVVALTSALSVLAIGQGQIDPNAVPVEREPQHHLVFANEFVRVIDARLPPGYKSLSHTHAQDNVAITISPGREDAQSMARIGPATFSKGGYSHVVTNSGTIELRFIAVEILKADRGGAAPAPDKPQHRLETENDRARVYRVKLAPGEALSEHAHAAGWLGVTVAGETPGAHQWYAAGTANALRAGDKALEIVELEPK